MLASSAPLTICRNASSQYPAASTRHLQIINFTACNIYILKRPLLNWKHGDRFLLVISARPRQSSGRYIKEEAAAAAEGYTHTFIKVGVNTAPEGKRLPGQSRWCFTTTKNGLPSKSLLYVSI